MMKHICIAVTLVLITLAVIAPSLTFASSDIENDLWKQQRQGIQAVYQCFLKFATTNCYRNGLKNIVSAELSLLSKGVSPKNPLLVSRLMTGLTSAGLPVFAWKLIKQRIYQTTTISLSPWGSFQDEKFRVTYKDREVFSKGALVKFNINERRN